MAENQNRVSVNTQGITFDYRVVYEDEAYLANRNVAGAYHSFGKVNGHKLLDYCQRCTDCRTNINRDSCLGDQFFSVDFIGLEERHFVDQSG